MKKEKISTTTKGNKFEKEVAQIFILLGYEVKRNIEICHKKIDLLASYKMPGSNKEHRIIIECKDEKTKTPNNQLVMQFKSLLENARKLQLADSAEIITRKQWSDQAKGFALDSGIELLTYNEKLNQLIDFSDYINRVVYDYEHYNEFITDKGTLKKNPIIDIMSRADLFKNYVQILFKDFDNPNEKFNVTIDSYILDQWLKQPENNHLSILGDFGTGKSSLCINLTYLLAKKYQKDPVNNRIPIFISLRGYSKAINLQQLITDLLINKYNVRIENYSVFQRFLESGRLVIIFDGFDEMISKTDRTLTISNFEELTKTVVPSSKTILTCRTHYFTEQSHIDKVFRPNKQNELFSAIYQRPNFKILELREFTDDQIKKLISHFRPNDWKNTWLTIRRDLYDLAKRPLLLDIIIKTIDRIFSVDKAVNIIHLYNLYTGIWIEREDWHAKMTLEGKNAFMENLAMNMWISGKENLHFQNLKKPIKEYFRDDIVTQADLDYYDHDTRTCSFLNRDMKGNYGFIHRSFMEFFIAKRIYFSIKNNLIDNNYREKEFSQAICNFIAQFVSEDVEALENLCSWAFDETYMLSWNAISVLPYLKRFEPKKVVNYLIRFSEKKSMKSGVTWVFGELGVNNSKVDKLLKNALRDYSNGSTWWESSFALKKLGIIDDPIEKLIQNLPSNWTYEKGKSSLSNSFLSKNKSVISVDQRAIIAIIKAYKNNKASKSEIEQYLSNIIRNIDLLSDAKGRRVYFLVWIIGELRIKSFSNQLIKLKSHPQLSVHNMLAEALGKIGEQDKSFIGEDGENVLCELLNDKYYRTRIHAAESLKKIKAYTRLQNLKDRYECESIIDVQRELLKSIEFLKS